MKPSKPKKNEPRVLFILKKREVPFYTGKDYTISSGLYYSAKFVTDMLQSHGVDAKLIEVTDNNDIDREVTAYRPTHVITEALWIVPAKFEILQKLHPTVQWVIRIHSHIPFLANDGVALQWLLEYLSFSNVSIAFNDERAVDWFIKLIRCRYSKWQDIAKKVYSLPNYYPTDFTDNWLGFNEENEINIGCFGAVRPLKNQLIQALAAVEFAKEEDLKLFYHINGFRVEQAGEPVLKNIRQLFAHLPADQFVLIEHNWLERPLFLELLATMTLSLQVSLSESFNIITADAVANGIPVVVSPEIDWVSSLYQADPNDVNDIVSKMRRALVFKELLPFDLNQRNLRKYSADSARTWLKFLTHG